MLRLLALAAVLAVPVAAQAPDPTPVVYLPGGASVEECRMQWQTTAAVRARTAPVAFAKVIRTIDGNRRVDANDYTEAVRVVLQPGVLRARRPIVLRAFGRGESERIELDAGETLDVLDTIGEGAAEFVWRGAVYQGELPGFSVQTSDPASELEVVRAPFVELWVRLVEHDEERPAAWLNTGQAGVIERTSDCG